MGNQQVEHTPINVKTMNSFCTMQLAMFAICPVDLGS